ncbi:hypothetical protein [Acinetobacter baumannii]|uniref:hypothetical protein n=1 Tax=Acinetobacter baumannii TaxID=470 RepID=UPI0020A6D667|nr:hypothetical protein [Acinetobacter baumannii]
MTDLNKKQAFWAEQLPLFKEKYWLPEHLDVLEFNMDGGCFEIPIDVKTDLSEDDLFDIYHRVNSGWAMWKKAVTFMQEKAKAQAVPDGIINKIQSWVAVKSFAAEDAHPDLPIIDANELAEFIDQLVASESGVEG